MKKFLFFLLLLIAIFFSPHFLPLNLKKALIQNSLKNIPGNIAMENVYMDFLNGILLEKVIWENKDTRVEVPFLILNSSLFFLIIPKETKLIFERGSIFYKEKLLVSKLKTVAPIKFNSEEISLRGGCTIFGKIHKEGTKEFTNHTLIPSFSGNSFSLTLHNASIKKNGLSSLNTVGDLNLNTLFCEKNKLLALTLQLLRQSPSKDMEIECGNISFKVVDGITVFNKTLFTIDHSYDILSKGTINFVSGNLNILIALSTSSLIKAFDFSHLPEGYIIPFTINGTISQPNIEVKEAAKAIAALLLLKKIDPERRTYPKVRSF